MTRGKQYVKKGIWYIGGKEKQKGAALSIGLLASIGASILGELAKPILGKFFGRGRRRRTRLRNRRRTKDERKNSVEKKNFSKNSNVAQRYNFYCKIREN